MLPPVYPAIAHVADHDRTNILEAHLQLQSLLKAEYSEEEIQGVALPPVSHLEAQLDQLL